MSLFVTPDNNLKTRIVAQAIVDDETQLSYEWVYQCVKEATGISPSVLVTDGDPAVNAAVMVQFPDTFHMHCIWHISQNLPKQLKGKLGSNFNDFMKDFYTARNSLKVDQFNERYTNYHHLFLLKFMHCFFFKFFFFFFTIFPIVYLYSNFFSFLLYCLLFITLYCNLNFQAFIVFYIVFSVVYCIVIIRFYLLLFLSIIYSIKVERFTTKLSTIKRLFNKGLRMQSSIMGTFIYQ